MEPIKCETCISWGYVDLLEIFFKANSLDITCEIRSQGTRNLTTLYYEADSDTAYSITFLSSKHLGFENMLCDYLIKCGIAAHTISVGRTALKRDMNKLEKDWQEHKQKLGI